MYVTTHIRFLLQYLLQDRDKLKRERLWSEEWKGVIRIEWSFPSYYLQYPRLSSTSVMVVFRWHEKVTEVFTVHHKDCGEEGYPEVAGKLYSLFSFVMIENWHIYRAHLMCFLWSSLLRYVPGFDGIKRKHNEKVKGLSNTLVLVLK